MGHPQNRLPDIENERIIVETLRRVRLQFAQMLAVAGVSGSPTGSPTVGAFTPTLIPVGETFTVPANKQVLFSLPILVDGHLIVDGDLIMVD
jgi:hypothetical protein